MRKAAGAGYSTATDLADWLVRALGHAVPRGPRALTGRIVAAAEAGALPLAKLPLAEMQAIEPRITDDVYLGAFRAAHSVKSRTSFGGTAPDNVRRAGPPLAETAGGQSRTGAQRLTVCRAGRIRYDRSHRAVLGAGSA